MDEISRQIAKARKRMNFQRFLSALPICFLVPLCIAAIAILVPRIWFLSFLPDAAAVETWSWGWLGGALFVGVLASILTALAHRRNNIQAAVAVDHEYGLKERISSALSLSKTEIDTPMGQAVLKDAIKRVQTIDVRDEFPIQLNWKSGLPLIPIALAFAIMLFAPVAKDTTASETGVDPIVKKRLEESEKALRKKLKEQREKAKELGLKDLDIALKEIEAKVSDTDPKEKETKKKAMAKLNDIRKELAKRQKGLGDSNALKKQLKKLTDSQNDGPGDKVTKALKNGDFDKAQDEVKKLMEKIKKDGLSQEQKQQLGKQLSELGEKLKNMSEQQERAKQELEKQIQQAKNDGNLDKAAELQQQLNKMQQGDRQAEQLKKLAESLQKSAEGMAGKDGQPPTKEQMQQAQEALENLQEQLSQMQQDSDAMEAIDDVMQQIAMSKGMLSEEPSDGGNFESPGEGGQGQGEGDGDGNGEGQGNGDRGEEKTDTGFFLSKVDGDAQKGEAIVTGAAIGANVSGQTRAEILESIQSNSSKDSDPQVNQRLPKSQKEHAREYFKKAQN